MICMQQLDLLPAMPVDLAAPAFHCAIANCDQPALAESEWCGYHQSERTRPMWPFPRMICRSWQCGQYAVPFGNGYLCREHGGVRA